MLCIIINAFSLVVLLRVYFNKMEMEGDFEYLLLNFFCFFLFLTQILCFNCNCNWSSCCHAKV